MVLVEIGALVREDQIRGDLGPSAPRTLLHLAADVREEAVAEVLDDDVRLAKPARNVGRARPRLVCALARPR